MHSKLNSLMRYSIYAHSQLRSNISYDHHPKFDFMNCISDCIIEYRLISKKGEGTFSEVLKAQSIKTGKYVAIKCMKAHFYNIDQVIIHTHHYLGQQLERNLST